MHRSILVAVFAALMALGTVAPALADDRCDDPELGLFPSEVGLCQAYCTHLDCDNINDGDPLSSPQASENACGNVAVSLLSQLTGLARSDVDPAAAMTELDTNFCDPCGGSDCPPPPGV